MCCSDELRQLRRAHRKAVEKKEAENHKAIEELEDDLRAAQKDQKQQASETAAATAALAEAKREAEETRAQVLQESQDFQKQRRDELEVRRWWCCCCCCWATRCWTVSPTCARCVTVTAGREDCT